MSLTLDDVRAAARRLGNRIHRTPVIACQSFDDACGHHVFFKCEICSGRARSRSAAR